MNAFHQVVEFNREIIGIQPRSLGLLDDEQVMFIEKAIMEELEEFISATESGDMIGAIDALLDGMYFAIGALYKMGLTVDQMEKCMTVIHEANMKKTKGRTKRDNDLDATKPEGWVSPEEAIGRILER